jgi:pimeloyl-ACP methyl ester carboxylesterase
MRRRLHGNAAAASCEGVAMIKPSDSLFPANDLWNLPLAWQEYWLDTAQRWVLSLDLLRQRGNAYVERTQEIAPHVLNFAASLLIDGRKLERPVNYVLVEIVPPKGITIDPHRRPFIIFDPRAGHGPGIGGMKHDSEIGVALREGHPCYFVGFLPEPVPGQTVEDVCAAEALFVKTVIDRHPEAEGRPVLIGNCQAGWQIMMMAAVRPDLTGPIMLAGSPLSYWAGVRGKNPMRYFGGLLGGTWLTALAGDLGNGVVDGANLIANFEGLNPANTLWKKPHNVFANIDTEASRFLEFEKWWGNPVLLTAAEMQSITDNLFVGNKLERGELEGWDGTRIDLRNIRSPIIVFCSEGDDITPPSQALQWILALYGKDCDIVTAGQTIVYCLHQSIGHLGIFVSGKVATKEHAEFAHAMDMIDITGPGLYEAVITGLDETVANPELVSGKYLFTLERRSLDDVRKICQPNAEDDRRFAAVARFSDVNRSLYQSTIGPVVKAMANEPAAEIMRRLHPNRIRFEMFSDRNPFMAMVPACADMVRANRRPASADNPLVAAEKALSDTIETTLQTWADQRDQLLEATFLAIYGMPLVQALAGLSPEREASEASPERDLALEAASKRVAQDAVARLRMGGPIAAALRALVYVLGGEKSVDERAFAVLVQIAANSPALQELGFGGFRDLLRDQQMIMRLEPERGVEVIPDMLADADMEARAGALRAITRVVSAGETLSKDGQARLEKISAMFTPTAGGTSRANRGRHLPRGRRTGQAGVRRKAVKNRD